MNTSTETEGRTYPVQPNPDRYGTIEVPGDDCIQRHRNGIGGVGFYTVRFVWVLPDDQRPRNMLATVFDLEGEDADLADQGEYYNPPTAVLDADEVGSLDAELSGWRGDNVDKTLRQAIAEWSERRWAS